MRIDGMYGMLGLYRLNRKLFNYSQNLGPNDSSLEYNSGQGMASFNYSLV